MESKQQSPHIAILPSPGMGHLIPFIEFAKRLVLHHHFSVTFVFPSDGSPMKYQREVLEALPPSITSVFLPPVSLSDLPPETRIEARIVITFDRSLPPIRDALQALTESTRLSAVVVDVFGLGAIDAAADLGIPRYVFYTSPAMALASNFYLPILDKSCSGEYRDLPEPVRIPGCVPIHGRDLQDPFQDRKNDNYKLALSRCRLFKSVDGIMVNSFLDLEKGAFEALMEEGSGKPPVYPVGPLIQTGPASGGEGSECLKWLDQQPRQSVIYVSFGSGGTLSGEQLNELAMGLEMSGKRFLWVVKSPNEKASHAAYFTVRSSDDPLNFLPAGFLNRMKSVGLVVPSWAPQIQVLNHSSTAAFLTHCGWNSTLEAVVHGVPMIAWPLFAEQRMNAAMLTDGLKVALRVNPNKDGLVVREEIARYVVEVVEGEEGKRFRETMVELRDGAAMAMAEGGSSMTALAEVADKWKKN